MEYQVKNPIEYKIEPNSIVRVTKASTIAEIPRETLDKISKPIALAHENINGFVSDEEFKQKIVEANTHIREQEANLVLARRKEEEAAKAGFAVISLLMIMGLLGIAVIVFLTVSNLIH